MDQAALTALLNELIATWENEVVEFKQAGNDYKTDTIGEYFSALWPTRPTCAGWSRPGWCLVWTTRRAG